MNELLADEFGITDLIEEVRRLAAEIAALKATKPWYTLDEAARYCKRGRPVIERWLDDGTLWCQQGTDSSKRLISRAALDSLQQRPTAPAAG